VILVRRSPSPSEAGYPARQSGATDLSTGPEFHPLNPPTSTPLSGPIPPPKPRRDSPSRRYVYWSDRSWEEYQKLRRIIEKRRLVGSGGREETHGRAGGRPPVGDATLQELLDAYHWKQRVCARAAVPRRVDETAVRALRVLYAPHPFGWLAPFLTLDRMVVQTFPSYRPPRRLHAIAGFCENGLLRPAWRTEDEWVIEDSAPTPTRIPEYHYLRGNLGYRPLDQEATLAA
jgi:hypothetical protein